MSASFKFFAANAIRSEPVAISLGVITTFAPKLLATSATFSSSTAIIISFNNLDLSELS